MMQIRRLKLIWFCMPLFVLGILAACSMPKASPGCAWMPDGGQYCLQPTSAVTAFDATQTVTMRIGDQTQTMIASIEVDASAMRVAALTPFGQKLFVLSYDNQSIHTETMIDLDRRLDPTLFLALLQIVLWPERAVVTGLASPMRLEDAGARRTIRNGEQVLMEIEHTGEQTPFRHVRIKLPERNISLEIDTVNTHNQAMPQ